MPKTVWIVPHTHFDAEVFLTQDETLGMALPHVLAALALLREHPEYRFVLDQKCYIEPFLRAYPEQRDILLELVREGRLDITCGMNAMADVNMPSGESFIRQVMSGKRYCEEELGVDPRCGWLIDSFGQHPQMPQLMTRCGFDHHVFQRVMPNDSPSEFYWKGIDGTELLCHWMPMGYVAFYAMPDNPRAFAEVARRRVEILERHAQTDHILALEGADLTGPGAHLLPMVAAFNQSGGDIALRFATPREFFEALGRPDDLPRVGGDLNPVFTGCYSARIRVKQWNRLLENRLVEAEKLDAVATLLGKGGMLARIDEAWEGVTFNQFHDIICGCQVDKVYDHVIERYQVCDSLADSALRAGLGAVTASVGAPGVGVPVTVHNTLSWDRGGPVEVSVGFTETDVYDVEVRDADGRAVPCDVLRADLYPGGGIKRADVLFIARDVPSMGCEVYRVLPASGEIPASPIQTSRPWPDMRDEYETGWMENEFFRIELNLWTGVLTRVLHKQTGWEAVDPARPFAGTIVREKDFGNFWQYNGPCKGDAFSPLSSRYPLPGLLDPHADFSHRYGGDGQIRQGRAYAECFIDFPFGTGYLASRVRLYAGVPWIEFRTTVVNHDERVRYRSAFPTSLPGGTTTHEIPFGAIDRPAGEFPAQNWIDQSDGKHGVALLNRGLPGNNVDDGVMMLSLLKCTAIKEGYGESGGFRLSTPTDKGFEIGVRHEFDYALAPHAGDWREAGCVRMGHAFNNPLVPVKGGNGPADLPSRASFLCVSDPAVVVSAVRVMGEATLVRVYETQGRGASGVTVETSRPLAAATEVNCLGKEEGSAAIAVKEGRLAFDLGPFEIKTFRCRFA